MYGYLADLMVFVHVLYVGYVVVGQVAIIVAGAFRWQWGRNPGSGSPTCWPSRSSPWRR